MARNCIDHLAVQIFDVPTASKLETDGTAEWSSATTVLVELGARGALGRGYSYAGCHGLSLRAVEARGFAA